MYPMKYLLLNIKHPINNIDHALNILRDAIREAVYLDRTLVIGTLTIDAAGNLGHTLENTSYNRYVDLDKTQICNIVDGNITQTAPPFHYINAEDFDLKAYPDDAVLWMESNKAVTEKLNDQYKVIIRKIATDEYNCNYSNILVRFFASDKVDKLSDIVLKTMGTNLETVKTCIKIHYGVDYAANSDVYQLRAPGHPAYYACLCLRYDNPAITSGKLYAMTVQQIENSFKRTQINKNRAVYIISDMDKSDHVDALKNRYTIYQYHDFPELKALISGENGREIDNAMLHSVEKNILQYAAIKIIPFEELSGFPIIYSNSSHAIPWRYKLLAWYTSLKNKLFFSA